MLHGLLIGASYLLVFLGGAMLVVAIMVVALRDERDQRPRAPVTNFGRKLPKHPDADDW